MVEGGVVGEVGMDGDDGDVAVGEGPFVTGLGWIVADEFAGEPQ